MRKVFCLLVAYSILLTVQSQNNPVQSKSKTAHTPVKKTPVKAVDSLPTAPSATKDARIAFFKKVQNEYVNQNLSTPLHKDTEKDWITSFDGMLQVGYRSPLAINRLHYAFADIKNRSIAFQQALLELLYGNFPFEYQAEVNQLMDETKNARIFALCVEYLIQDERNDKYRSGYRRLLDQKMQYDPFNPSYKALKQRLDNKTSPKTPPFSELLSYEFLAGSVILYSIQKTNRDYPGVMIVRKADGKFLRNPDNSLFYITQLARSITNLPYYFDNGNTPQGVYRMCDFETSKNPFIGPTEFIRLLLPFEAKVSEFNPNLSDPQMKWYTVTYRSFLPKNWKNYEPMNEAFYSGMAGRKDTRIHGTTINPEYYAGKSWYPQTPYLGGLSSLETWDEKTGKRLESDQVKLIGAVKKAGGGAGYCVVVEMDDKAAPVQITDLQKLVDEIEGKK